MSDKTHRVSASSAVCALLLVVLASTGGCTSSGTSHSSSGPSSSVSSRTASSSPVAGQYPNPVILVVRAGAIPNNGRKYSKVLFTSFNVATGTFGSGTEIKVTTFTTRADEQEYLDLIRSDGPRDGKGVVYTITPPLFVVVVFGTFNPSEVAVTMSPTPARIAGLFRARVLRYS